MKLTLLLGLTLVSMAIQAAVLVFEPEFGRDLALEQLENTDQGVQQVRAYELSRESILLGLNVAVVFAALALYGKEIMSKVTKLFLLLCLLSSVGCWRPYDTPEFHEIGSSHTAFLVPLEGDTTKQAAFDSEEFLQKNMVAQKRVQIPHKWVQTGRWPGEGRYTDTMRLITVDRAPVTREWTADGASGTVAKNQGLWVESRDSVGFSTGVTCTARIPDDDSAIKFLYNYPAATSSQSVQGQSEQQIVDTSKGLEAVMDTEIRAQVQTRMADFAALVPMDTLRERKPEMLEYIRHGTLPADLQPEGHKTQVGVIEFFAERGIEITTLGQFGGFTYENKKIQESIDNVFSAQQDEEVAKAESKAQKERNEAVKLAAEGKAEAARLQAKGEADAIQMVADAKAYEIEKAQENWVQYLSLKQLEIEEKRLEKWDGKYPTSFLGGSLPGGGLLLDAAKPGAAAKVMVNEQ